MAKLILPPLKDDSTVPQIAKNGEWSKTNNLIYGLLAESINVSDLDQQSEEFISIPDMWARPSVVADALYNSNLANQPYSIHVGDGLKLKNIYITVALKCVPPFDKPNSDELKSCFNFLKNELDYLRNIKTILTLGRIAFEACIKFFQIKRTDAKFIHGEEYMTATNQRIVACYHPSPRNVNTKRINEKGMVDLLTKIHDLHRK